MIYKQLYDAMIDDTAIGTYDAEDDVSASYADTALKSFLHHLPNLPAIPMGSDRKAYKKAKKHRMRVAKELVMRDVCEVYGLDHKEAIGMIAAIALFLFGGPLALVVAIVAAVVQWCVLSHLNNKMGSGAFEAARAELGEV